MLLNQLLRLGVRDLTLMGDECASEDFVVKVEVKLFIFPEGQQEACEITRPEQAGMEGNAGGEIERGDDLNA